MKNITKTTTVYNFDELTETAQNNALELNRDINISPWWFDCTTEDFKEIGSKIGIDIDDIYFSGFWSQGDGACFTGNYSYKKGAVKTIKKEYPHWQELHDIAQQLQSEQKRFFYGITTTVNNKGHYNHENSVQIESYDNNKEDYASESCTIGDTLQDFMRLIYSTLEKEYNYHTSDDAVKEYLIEHEFQFLECGEEYE